MDIGNVYNKDIGPMVLHKFRTCRFMSNKNLLSECIEKTYSVLNEK